MNVYRVSFIGHRQIDRIQAVEDALLSILTELLRTKKFVEFQIGRNSDLDIFAASCIKRVQKAMAKITPP